MKQTKTKHPLWKRYHMIKYHCESVSSNRYRNYGGRGIQLDPAWSNDFWSFASWVEANIGLPTSHLDVLERIDNDGNYEPGNLSWTTQKLNSNNRQDNRVFEINGQTRTLTEWCELTGTWLSTAIRRLDKFGLEPKYAVGLEPHPQVRKQKNSGRVR